MSYTKFPPPNTRQLSDVRLYELESPYSNQIVFDYIHCIRPPFVFDYASTPSLTWWWLGPPADYSGPAAHHDDWCRAARTFDDRLAADALFLVLLHRWQIAHFRRPRHLYTKLFCLPLEFEWWVDRTVMFLALRVYAWCGFWKNDTERTNGEPKRFLRYVTGAKTVAWYRKFFKRRT